MNFEQLRSLVKNIKAKMPCPSCGMNFENEDIHVLNSIHDASIFTVQCHHCHAALFVTATLHPVKKENESKVEQEPSDIQPVVSSEPIDADDVLNIHEFLKDFSGDFQNTFEESEKLKTKS